MFESVMGIIFEGVEAEIGKCTLVVGIKMVVGLILCTPSIC